MKIINDLAQTFSVATDPQLEEKDVNKNEKKLNQKKLEQSTLSSMKDDNLYDLDLEIKNHHSQTSDTHAKKNTGYSVTCTCSQAFTCWGGCTVCSEC